MLSRMGRPIDNAFLKLDWAQEHLTLLHKEIGAFAETDPRSWTYREIDRETGRDVLRTGFIPRPPDRIGLIFQDVVHNARAALDYAVYRPAGRGEIRSEFPIYLIGRSRFRNKRTYSKDGIKGVQHLPRPAQEFIEEVQPYHRRTGQRRSILWRLQDLSRSEKHHGVPLIARGGEREYSEVFTSSSQDLPERMDSGIPWFDQGDVAAVLWSPQHPEIHFKPSLILKVFLAEDGPRRWELGHLAQAMVNDTTRILAELRRLL